MKRAVLCAAPCVCLCIWLCGCVSAPMLAPGPDSGLLVSRVPSQPALDKSLFSSDQAVLSNDALREILELEIRLPREARVAVLQLGADWRWVAWSGELSRLHQEADDGLIGKLKACTRVTRVGRLPSLLTPEKQTVPYLREAAARYQADLLLVFRAYSNAYQKGRFLRPDQVRSYCMVEALLLDTRTGIVPFTATAREEYTTTKAKEDLSIGETFKKAELTALRNALDAIGDDVAAFLGASDEGQADNG